MLSWQQLISQCSLFLRNHHKLLVVEKRIYWRTIKNFILSFQGLLECHILFSAALVVCPDGGGAVEGGQGAGGRVRGA